MLYIFIITYLDTKKPNILKRHKEEQSFNSDDVAKEHFVKLCHKYGSKYENLSKWYKKNSIQLNHFLQL